ncbi:MAG: lipid A 4'-phosphatase [Planctomycetota bacterium]|jgi:lipid A 4'-phosphatase
MKKSTLLKTPFRFDVIAFLSCIAFFLVWPDLDLMVSELFYDSGQGGFFLKYHVLAETIYRLTDIIGITLVVGLPALVAISYLAKIDFLAQGRTSIIFLLTVCIIGPGLMVNLVLKDNWGRPRPRQVIEFGGERLYQPALSPTFECNKCYSFVSGHASVGFFFFAFALLARNRKWLWLPVLAGAVIGGTRVVQGAHFFSDVVFSGWVVWFCSLLLYQYFFAFKKVRSDVDLTIPAKA